MSRNYDDEGIVRTSVFSPSKEAMPVDPSWRDVVRGGAVGPLVSSSDASAVEMSLPPWRREFLGKCQLIAAGFDMLATDCSVEVATSAVPLVATWTFTLPQTLTRTQLRLVAGQDSASVRLCFVERPLSVDAVLTLSALLRRVAKLGEEFARCNTGATAEEVRAWLYVSRNGQEFRLP